MSEDVTICTEKVKSGWRFESADFSILACGGRASGTVRFIRDPDGVKKWHMLPDEIKESDHCPRLYVYGVGETLGEAVMDANLAASKYDTIG